MEVLVMRKAKLKRPDVMTRGPDWTRRYCEKCGEEICRERLDVLPSATTCVSHSNARPITVHEPDVVSGAEREDLQKMMNGD